MNFFFFGPKNSFELICILSRKVIYIWLFDKFFIFPQSILGVTQKMCVFLFFLLHKSKYHPYMWYLYTQSYVWISYGETLRVQSLNENEGDIFDENERISRIYIYVYCARKNVIKKDIFLSRRAQSVYNMYGFCVIFRDWQTIGWQRASSYTDRNNIDLYDLIKNIYRVLVIFTINCFCHVWFFFFDSQEFVFINKRLKLSYDLFLRNQILRRAFMPKQCWIEGYRKLID